MLSESSYLSSEDKVLDQITHEGELGQIVGQFQNQLKLGAPILNCFDNIQRSLGSQFLLNCFLQLVNSEITVAEGFR